MQLKDLFPLLKDAVTAFGETKCARLAAALSYYTIFSIAPILIVVISIAALFFNADAARNNIIEQIGNVVGSTGAQAIGEILTNANKGGKGGNIIASIVGFATILVGATGLFAALQDSLNTIWGVEPKPDAGIFVMIKARLLSFVMVLGIGFLLIVSLVASVAVKALADWLGGVLGGAEWIAPVLNVVIFFLLITVFFAGMFKVLPDAEIQWRDVWVGAGITSLLFSAGKFALSWYLARPGTASAYGSAGALVVLLLWINYASQILFFGAEFTKVYANRFGSKIEPEKHAQEILPEHRAAQGIAPHPKTVGATSNAKAKTAPRDPQGKLKPGALPSDKTLTPAEKTAKIAELRAESKKNFEFSMAVVAGALMAVVVALKKRENDHYRDVARRSEPPAKPTPNNSRSNNPRPGNPKSSERARDLKARGRK